MASRFPSVHVKRKFKLRALKHVQTNRLISITKIYQFWMTRATLAGASKAVWCYPIIPYGLRRRAWGNCGGRYLMYRRLDSVCLQSAFLTIVHVEGLIKMLGSQVRFRACIASHKCNNADALIDVGVTLTFTCEAFAWSRWQGCDAAVKVGLWVLLNVLGVFWSRYFYFVCSFDWNQLAGLFLFHPSHFEKYLYMHTWGRRHRVARINWGLY